MGEVCSAPDKGRAKDPEEREYTTIQEDYRQQPVLLFCSYDLHIPKPRKKSVCARVDFFVSHPRCHFVNVPSEDMESEWRVAPSKMSGGGRNHGGEILIGSLRIWTAS